MFTERWRRRVARVGAVRVLVVAGGGVVLAAALPTWAVAVAGHQVSLTVRDVRVISSGNKGTSAGVFSGTPYGRGVIVQRVTVISVNGPVAKTRVTFTIFTAAGTASGTGHGTRTTNPDGSASAVGTRTITRGTGAYRGARGQLTITGTTARNGITTSHWVGSARYGVGRGPAHPIHTRRTYAFTLSVRSVAVAAKGSPPLNGSDTQASLVNGTLAGKAIHGAGWGVNSFPAPGVGKTVGTVIGPAGSVNFTITATGTPNPDGSFSFHGKGKITSGSGDYEGASGTFKELRGSASTNGPSTATFSGTITY